MTHPSLRPHVPEEPYTDVLPICSDALVAGGLGSTEKTKDCPRRRVGRSGKSSAGKTRLGHGLSRPHETTQQFQVLPSSSGQEHIRMLHSMTAQSRPDIRASVVQQFVLISFCPLSIWAAQSQERMADRDKNVCRCQREQSFSQVPLGNGSLQLRL